MTEEEWLACTDPIPMLEFLQGKVSDRKLRLFACACCRRVWDILPPGASRRAVEASERFADRLITVRQLTAACGAAQKVARKILNTGDPESASLGAAQAAHLVAKSAQTIPSRAELMAWLPAAVVHNILGSATALEVGRSDDGKQRPVRVSDFLARPYPLSQVVREQLAALLRDVIGNPFRPCLPVPPEVLAWNQGAVPRLAQGIYEERAFDRLPVLADALEEAGYADGDLLAHCRAPGPHAKGCWAVDVLLRKQ